MQGHSSTTTTPTERAIPDRADEPGCTAGNPKHLNSRNASLWLMLLLGTVSSTAADVPRLIHYQGKLRDSSGATADGMHGFRFRLYDAEIGGNILLDETHGSVAVTNGLFSVLIGSQTAGGVLDAALDAADVYLGVSVNGGAELLPRSKLVGVPHAIKARSAEQLVRPGTYVSAVNVDPTTGNVGVGMPTPTTELDVAGTVRATGLHLPTGAAEGHVLTSDASGVGAWQAPADPPEGVSGWVDDGSEAVPAFDGDGIIQENLSGNDDAVRSMALDADYLYLAGHVNYAGGADSNWQIEKREKASGALVTTFDGDGVSGGSRNGTAPPASCSWEWRPKAPRA